MQELKHNSLYKNFERHERCRDIIIWLLTLKKVHKNDCGMFTFLMPELVMEIAKKIWETRNDDLWAKDSDIWKEQLSYDEEDSYEDTSENE